jgi:hypothetical protein
MVLRRDTEGTIKHIENAKVAVYSQGVDTSSTDTKVSVGSHKGSLRSVAGHARARGVDVFEPVHLSSKGCTSSRQLPWKAVTAQPACCCCPEAGSCSCPTSWIKAVACSPLCQFTNVGPSVGLPQPWSDWLCVEKHVVMQGTVLIKNAQELENYSKWVGRGTSTR